MLAKSHGVCKLFVPGSLDFGTVKQKRRSFNLS